MLNFVFINYFNFDFLVVMTIYYVYVIIGIEFGFGTNVNVFVKFYGDKDYIGMFLGNLFLIYYWRFKKIMINYIILVCFLLEKKNMN